MNLNNLPLDCLRLIAEKDLTAYKAMLMVRRFAMTTLGKSHSYRDRFGVRPRPKYKNESSYTGRYSSYRSRYW
jgi:hypothetical protein